MSAEWIRDEISEQAAGRWQSPSRFRLWAKSCSYGPFGYPQAALVGFLLGGVGFLIGDGLTSSNPGAPDHVAALLACLGGGAGLLLVAAALTNYTIGRRIFEDLELQREIFAGGSLPPLRPRPDVPGIVLQKRESTGGLDRLHREIQHRAFGQP